MKIFVLILTLLTSVFFSSAENYFQDGMVWNELVYTDADADTDDLPARYWIDGDTIYNGEKALKLYGQVNEGKKSLITVLKVEKEKVYYIHNQGSTEWRLMYDFGLAPGEECKISLPSGSWNNSYTPATNEVKCTSMSMEDSYPGFEVINFDEYSTKYADRYEGSGTWLKGLGSTRGILNNIGFGFDGGGGCIVSAYLNGVQVYPDPSGVESVQDNTPALCVKAEDKTLVISGIDTGSALAVCTSDGKVVYSEANPSSALRVRIPSNGVYIVSNGSRAVKTVVK